MSRRIITVGDATDHGGVVITGYEKYTISGKAVARVGDLVACPLLYPDKRPHGINKIVEGADNYKVDGVAVALEGHHTECGCALMGSGHSRIG